MTRRIASLLFMAGSSLLGVPEVAAQDVEGSPVPVAAFSVGLGNPYGWFGGALEVFGLQGRASVRAGLGYLPRDPNGRPGFIAYAGSVRAYFGNGPHQVTVEGSYSLLTSSSLGQGGVLLNEVRRYGPSAALGYRHTGSSGVHLDINLGGGWSSGGNRWRPTTGVGVGYTVK